MFLERQRLLLCLLIASLTACSKEAAQLTEAAPPVRTAQAKNQMVANKVAFSGTVAASQKVDLVARVSGYLRAAPFAEGQSVSKGQLLFQIEPESYREEVQINQAKVGLARTEAARQVALLAENATAQSSLDSARSELTQAQANLRLSQLNLSYTEIRAPFDGLIGRRQVDVGNYVGADAGGTVLATLQKVRPAYVDFSVNENQFLQLRANRPAGSPTDRPVAGLVQVSARLQGPAPKEAQGTLDFIGDSLDSETGSFPLRAIFPNDDLELLPGLYAKVTVDTGTALQSVMVPELALLADQEGAYVFVVSPQRKVARRKVVKGRLVGADREITSGLRPGEQVVVEGFGRIKDGSTVSISNLPAKATP